MIAEGITRGRQQPTLHGLIPDLTQTDYVPPPLERYHIARANVTLEDASSRDKTDTVAAYQAIQQDMSHSWRPRKHPRTSALVQQSTELGAEPVGS